jgi:hypothetical protein
MACSAHEAGMAVELFIKLTIKAGMVANSSDK